MSDFWLGVVSVPAAVVLGGVAIATFRWLLVVAGKAAVALIRVTPEASDHARAMFGATAYATKRSWYLAAGDFGIAVFSGQRPDVHRKAFDRLYPKRSLERIRRGDDDG